VIAVICAFQNSKGEQIVAVTCKSALKWQMMKALGHGILWGCFANWEFMGEHSGTSLVHLMAYNLTIVACRHFKTAALILE